jgi:hypothetical protein
MSTEGEKMKGYKGFNDKLQCTPDGKVFQYEVGKEYVHDGDAELCSQGFHFCENPLDTLRYYQPATGRYAEVEAEGVAKAKAEDSKRVAKKLKIIAEVNLKSLIEIGVKFLLSKSENPTTGNSSPAATSGYYSPAATSGYSSPAATSGYSSPAATSGKESIAASIGYNAQAKAALGSWIVLAEYKSGTREVLTVKTAKVDGKELKADTFYQLKKGKFVAVGARRSSR